MTDEQLEAGIEAITAMLEARDAGSQAKVIDAMPEPAALPALKARRKRRKSETLDVMPDGADPAS
jgi:hypothetical protein